MFDVYLKDSFRKVICTRIPITNDKKIYIEVNYGNFD